MLPHSDDVDVHPVCTDPVWLPYVDAAFKRPGGPEAKHLAAKACRGCPVQLGCLDEALAGPEHGVWAGTSPIARTKAGGRSASHYANIADLHRASSPQPPTAAA